MDITTKDRILNMALTMFAENGYKGTNLRDLAAALGLSKSALYKHYESKEAIWNALLDKMIAYYEQRFGSPEHLPPIPSSVEELLALTMRMIRFTVYDPQIILTRKLLLTEQFHDPRACRMATKYFMESNAGIYTRVFAGMMDAGLLPREEPRMMAFAYTAPISTLVHLCDRIPDRREEVLQQIESFSRYFFTSRHVL